MIPSDSIMPEEIWNEAKFQIFDLQMTAGNPRDRAAEDAIGKERRFIDPKENSVDPSFMENRRLAPGLRNDARRRATNVTKDC
jgi:hypothetical protein